LQGYGQKQELLRTEAEAKRLRERQAEQDKLAQGNAMLARLQSGARPFQEGETLGEGEQLADLPGLGKMVIGPSIAERTALQRALNAEKAAKTKQDYENRGIYETLTTTINPDTKKPFLDPALPFSQVQGRLQSALELAKQKIGQSGSMDRVLAAQVAQGQRWDARADQQARNAYNSNLKSQESNYRTTTKDIRAKAEGVLSLIDALSKKNATFDQAAMDSFIRAITGKSPVNAQYETTQRLGSLPDRARQAFERAMKGGILPPSVRRDMMDYAKTLVASGEEELAPLQENVGAQLRSQAEFNNVNANVPLDSAVAAPNYFKPATEKLQRLRQPQQTETPSLFVPQSAPVNPAAPRKRTWPGG
jgi:hypothetical protein